MPETARKRRAWGGTIRSFIRFAITGAAGFAVDAATLSLLLATTGLGPYFSRALSFPVALGITWYLNRIWTFERTDQARLPQSARYVMVQLLGAAFNFAIFALCISIGPPVFGRFPIIALAIASAAAMILNFVGSRHWAFSGER
ncbi:MAG: GtrA family protein [Sphingomonadaceae bacterium]|nr:GtrA family protein [Sphingomonadaceae bacterium]